MGGSENCEGPKYGQSQAVPNKIKNKLKSAIEQLANFIKED